MFKQLFKNAFQPKEAKFGFNLNFVSGTLNHNPISKLKAGKCALNFENQIMYIKQGDEVLTENVSDIESIRTWTYKRKAFVMHIFTKTHNEYKFSTAFDNENMLKMLILESLTRYANAHNIPNEFCGDFSNHGDSEDDE